jgi:hypothetical protein
MIPLEPLRRLVRCELPLVLVLLLALGLVLVRSQTREIEPDEIEALHSGWMVLAGERPYGDFIQQHHPLHYALLAGVMYLTGEGSQAIVAARALHFAMFLGILALVFRIALEVFGREAGRRIGLRIGLYAALLLATSAVFANKVFDVRPDIPMILTGLVALQAFLRHERDPRARHLVIGGLALGLSFLFLQKALFLMAALLLLAAVRIAQGRMRARELGLALASLALVVAPFYAWLAASGTFRAYYAANWQVNADGQGGFGPIFWLMGNVRASTVLWVFFGLGLLFFTRKRLELELALVALALLGSLWVMPRPWPYYALPAMPLMALVAGRALAGAFGEQRHLAAATLLLGAAPGLYYLLREPYPRMDHRLAMIELARSATPPGERVHDGDNQFNVFRRPLDYYWYSLGKDGVMERYEKVAPRGYDLEGLFREHAPRVVATSELAKIDPAIAAHYAPSALDPSISLRVEPYAVGGAAQGSTVASLPPQPPSRP